MPTRITVQTKIRVKGQEYANENDMPPDIRDAYEQALGSIDGGAEGARLNISDLPRMGRPASNARIIFNGEEYSSVEQMPAQVRGLYDDVIATLAAAPAAATPGGTDNERALPRPVTHSIPASPVGMGAARPESVPRWLVIAGVVIALWLFASLVLGQ